MSSPLKVGGLKPPSPPGSAVPDRIVQESTKDQGGLLNSCIREGKKLTESFQGRIQDFLRGTPNFPNPP